MHPTILTQQQYGIWCKYTFILPRLSLKPDPSQLTWHKKAKKPSEKIRDDISSYKENCSLSFCLSLVINWFEMLFEIYV